MMPLLAITLGQGILKTATCPHLAIHAGDIFILFPSQWHRFRPVPKTGWNESFVGFDGDYGTALKSRVHLAAALSKV